MPSSTSGGHNKSKKTAGAGNRASAGPPAVEGEAFFESVFRALPQNLVVWRILRDERAEPYDLLMVAVTDSLARMMDVEERSERRVSEFDPDFRTRDPDILEVCARVAASGAPETHQGYYSALDKHFQITVSPLTGDRMLAALEDITDRVRAEKALQRLQYSIDQMDDYPAWTDSEGRIIEVSESTCRHLGYTRDELLNMTVFDICPDVEMKSWHRAWTRHEPLAPFRLEVHHRHQSGRVFPVEITVNPMVFDGERYHCTFCRDVSERKQLEESLRLTQLSVEHAPDMMHWVDSDGRITYANRSTCEFLGYSVEELQTMRIWDVSPGLTRQLFEERWRMAVDADIRLAEEVWRTKDGRECFVDISARNVWQDGRQLALAFVRDVSERKQAEQRLQLMQYSLDHSNDYPLWTDSDGRIVEVSESTCRHLEYTRDELLSMTMFDINPALTSEEWTANLEGKRKTGTVFIQGPHRTKTGKEFPVEGSVSMITFGGVEYGCAFCRDITERKKAEESLLLTQLSVDAAADMVHWTDMDGRLVYANQSLLDCLGYTKEELLSLYVWDIVQGLSPELVQARREHARGGDSFRREGMLKAKDGRLVPMEVSSSWVELNDRLLAISTNRDISERTEMLHTLRERDEQLRQSQKMEAVGRLAGGIAHDFNNVLTTIIGYSDLLLNFEEALSQSILEDVGEIKAAAERASGLTRRILAFSRRQALQPARLSLNQIVSDTKRMLERTIGADVELRTSLSPDLSQVEVDEGQFVQVLLNLAVNARDAMPGGGSLTLGTSNVDLDEQFCETHPEVHPGPHVLLAVNDTGTGIDAEVLPHIFEPFYTTKPVGQGTGLGLATVYGIVTQSGGCIYVKSEPGRGTTFSVYLPQAAPPGDPEAAHATTSSTESDRQTVMVVDADAAYLSLTKRVLERRGYEVLPFTDAAEAAAALADPNVRVDALLADLELSGSLTDGKSPRSAAKSRPELPTLFMSAQTRDTMKRSEQGDDCDGLLEKPFTAEELTRRLRTCLSDAHSDGPPASSEPKPRRRHD